jgi:hypothetical protein
MQIVCLLRRKNSDQQGYEIIYFIFWNPGGEGNRRPFLDREKKNFPTPASLIGPAAKAKDENTPSGEFILFHRWRC